MPFIEHADKRVLFIHIPKTGGTSIEKAMEQVSSLHLCARTIPGFLHVPPEHFTYQNIFSLFNEGYFDFIFTIVRNPYHRLESEYRMRCILAKEQFFTELPRFPIWMEHTMNRVKRDPGYRANHLRPQIEFLGSDVNVYKYEDGLENIVKKVNAATGLELQLPASKMLTTENFNNQIKWTTETVREVNQYYREDFKVFGYQQNPLEYLK